MLTLTYYVDHPRHDELEFDIYYEFSPGAPARIHGPPEDCYPAESDEVEFHDFCWILDERGKRWMQVNLDDMVRRGLIDLDSIHDQALEEGPGELRDLADYYADQEYEAWKERQDL